MKDQRIQSEKQIESVGKKPYTRPQLVRHGKVETMTEQSVPNPSTPLSD